MPSTSYSLPTGLWIGLRGVHACRRVFHRLGAVESRVLRRRLGRVTIDRPIYICALPRCGTTVTLELLSRHPDVATHRYADMLMPYLPYVWNHASRWVGRLFDDRPRERLQQDRIIVTNFSPEGVEELWWLLYFPQLHRGDVPSRLGAGDENPTFDCYYRDAIKKLLLATGRGRYLSKANDNVSRLAYLHRLFPDARFLVLVRHPAQQIASMVRFDRLLRRLARDDARIPRALAITGHLDFGPSKVWTSYFGSAREMRRAYDEGDEVGAWAMRWTAAYRGVLEQLRASPELAARTLTVRYEDLCRSSAQTIHRILAHCDLDAACFEPTRRHFVEKLSEPTYYRHDFAPAELARLDTITRATRVEYGYADAPTGSVTERYS